MSVSRVPNAFSAEGRTFEPGTFLIAGDRALANRLANDDAIELYALAAPPAATPLSTPSIAVFADEGTTSVFGPPAPLVQSTPASSTP